MKDSSTTLARPPSGVRSRGPLVIVVDGDEATSALYAAGLATSGFMVLEAHDGESAVEKATQFGPHAMVLDLILPGCDGLLVTRMLREIESTREMCIVGVSAMRPEIGEPMALSAGCDAFFAKPIMGATLAAELIRLLAKRVGHQGSPDLSRVMR
jgi:two-component system cell cycle response regulator DivK